MNAPGGAAMTPWPAVAALGGKARAADSLSALGFTIVNDTFALLPYRSALLLRVDGPRVRLVQASGLATVDRKSAYGSWVEQAVAALLRAPPDSTRFTAADLPEPLRAGWADYWPQTVHLHRLAGHQGHTVAVVAYLSDVAWPAAAEPMLLVLHQLYAAAFDSLRLRRRGLAGGGWRLSRALGITLLLLIAAAAVMRIPIRQFVIAPADIISLESIAVTSPVEGIIASLEVRPNQAVRRGDVLARLDDTSVRNRLESATQALEVSRAEYLAAMHRSIIASERSAEVGVLRGRINERLAEVAFLQDQLRLLDLRASRDGIAVYGQVNDLIGKPVSPGQKVMELADPSRIGVQVWVPVADAINLQSGERFNLMLYADPLNARGATIEQASYQAMRSPDGVAAYRVRATLDAQDASRLGLRGNAKINGDEVPLGYFLFRRPLLVVRQWLGI